MLFNKKTLEGDIFGGISAGILALPVALAFGSATGLAPINGLYGAIMLGLLAALFGGTNTLISNPTGPMAVATYGIVQTFSIGLGTNEISVILPYLIITFFLAGFLQLVFGLFKVGKTVNYIPHPVISGFMSGIGVIIIIGQFNDFFGIDDALIKSTFHKEQLSSLDKILNIRFFIENLNNDTVLLALATILIIRLFPYVTKKIPSTLVALIIVSTVSYLLNLEVEVIAHIPKKLPKIELFHILKPWMNGEVSNLTKIINFKYANEILFSALFLAGLGMIDSLLTSVVADKMTKTKHNSDRELIGQGIGNMVSALIGGIPGAGTTPATVLNINSGGRTRLSGIIHAVFLILVLLVFAPIAEKIPFAVLAGVLINIGLSILDYSAIKQFKNIPTRDNFVMITVFVLTVSWSLLYAVGIGLIISALIFMKKMADVVELESKNTKINRLANNIIDTFDNSIEFREQVLIKNMRGPLFFGFASRFQSSIQEVGNPKVVVINMSGVTYMDQSGLYTLRDAIVDLQDKGIMVTISESKDEQINLLKKNKIIPDMIESRFVFSSIEENIMWLNEPGHLDRNFDYEDELYIPSAYTPNGDGINDEWQIKNIEKYPNCKVKITNRDGLEVFYSEGYKIMWEGELNGEMLPPDKYLYEIDLGDDMETKLKGSVMIFR